MRPSHAEAHNILGAFLQLQDKFNDAAACYQRALEVNPGYADAYYNYGTLLQRQGSLGGAAELFERAAALKPNYVEAHHGLGLVCLRLGRLDEAVANLQIARQLRPQSAEVSKSLRRALATKEIAMGNALGEHEDLAAAVVCYRRAVALDPDFAEAHNNLGSGLQRQHDFDEALEHYDCALKLKPEFALAYFNRASLLGTQNKSEKAIADYQQALRLKPNYSEAYSGMAVAFYQMALADAALECCRKALDLDPKLAECYDTMAGSLHLQGRGEEAIAAYRKAVELRPDVAAEYSNLLYSLNFVASANPADVFAEHLNWARLHAEPLTARAAPHANDRSPERRLKIGYVSPNFCDHAVNFFVEPVLTSHDHGPFEIFCYSDVSNPDAVTERLRGAADHWRDVCGQSDERVADLIRNDRIDILVDLTGHIANNRLLAFARKPAPIQVTYLGYQNTSGMSAMDYRLTDQQADPPGLTDPFYTERLVRLPRAFFCFRPPDEAPPLKRLPAKKFGQITFGSFNSSKKLTPETIDAWLHVLARVPRSRLLVLAHRGGYLENHLRELAQSRGLERHRVELYDKRARADYLELQQRADIALDPFPFNGHTTSCDSLWMGLPVVMLRGNSYASRFGASALVNVGLESLIADSVEQYIEIAVELSSDLDRLAELRGELRQRMADSALLDPQGFTRNLERAYRQMWHTWCSNARP